MLHSAAEVAAEVAGVLPEGCWTFGAIEKLGVLALNKEVVLGVDLRAVEYLVRCVFTYILSWLELDAAGAARVVLLLGIGLLLLIEAAGAAVNLVAL